jgi:hypothetical protein
MPGFNIGQHQGGDNPSAPSNTYETRRKHRWVFETLGQSENSSWTPNELLVLKTASRPKFKFNTADMHHNQEVVYFAGKQEWEPVTLTWYDVEQNPNISKRLYDWLQSAVTLSAVGLPGPAGAAVNLPVQAPNFYKRQGELAMIDGKGVPTERWNMLGTWPESCTWEELDYSANEVMTCQAVMRYDRAVKTL